MARVALVVADVDGTLLNSRHELTAATRRVVAAVRARGIEVVLASARPPGGLLPLLEALALTTPYVALNGALVMERASGILRRWALPQAVARDVLARAGTLTANVYAGCDWWVEREDDWVAAEARAVGFGPRVVDRLAACLPQEVDKILLMGPTGAIACLQDALTAAAVPVSMATSNPGYLEITSPQASKARAVDWVVESLGVDRARLLAIGDGQNDADVLRQAGISVAMGQADPELRRWAHHVTASADDDGFAQALERFVLSGEGL